MGEEVVIKLFGSRLDDAGRGGDIDLYIATHQVIEQPAYTIAMIQTKIMRLIGERKIDILLDAPNLTEEAIHGIAKAEGVNL